MVGITRHSSRQNLVVIFLHIPKAAGSTMHSLLKRNYEPDSIFTIHGPCIELDIADFRELPMTQRARIRFISGHMPFGIHELVTQPSTYITLMRNPVDRVISRYYYTLRTPDNYLYDPVTSQNLSLEGFVRSGISTELDNGQTRLLAGVKGVPFGQCTTEMLESAKENLREHFAVVGISERFDASLLLVNQIFGWQTRFYLSKNVTKNRPRKEDVSSGTLDIIEDSPEKSLE